MKLFLMLWLGCVCVSRGSLMDMKGCEFLAILCRVESMSGLCEVYFKDSYQDCVRLYNEEHHRKEWHTRRKARLNDPRAKTPYDSFDSQLDDLAQRIHKLSTDDGESHVKGKRSFQLFDEFTHSKDFDEFVDEYKPNRVVNFHDGSKDTTPSPNDPIFNPAPVDAKDTLPVKEVIDNVVTSDLLDSKAGPASEGGKRGAIVSPVVESSNMNAGVTVVSEQEVNTEQNADVSPHEEGKLILTVAQPVAANDVGTFASSLQNTLWSIPSSSHQVFVKSSSVGNKIQLHMMTSPSWFKSEENAADVAKNLNLNSALRDKVKADTGVAIVNATSEGAIANVYAHPYADHPKQWSNFALLLAVIGGSTLGLLCAAMIVLGIKRCNSNDSKFIGMKQDEATADYQALCRTQMSLTGSGVAALKDSPEERQGLVSGSGKVVKKAWGEEPTAVNMDISTGHVVLAYMEDHLTNDDRLRKEWEALCSYKPDLATSNAGSSSRVLQKNRYQDVVPYDHTRVKLKATTSSSNSDYVNASFVTDVDPRYPAYIATQGPLDNTVADFWQMVWEQGVVVIVNLTRLSDMGMPQCHRYWPEDGSEVYHNFEVHLISEHIWCDDYLVRSFYLKNLQTNETRTVTQFHFLTWQDLSIPESPRPLLEFRRKVNKCYKGQACPIIVHCNNGVGRTGTYILVDMVLNKMIKGAKEIDIAATLEHLRDQRQDMVKTKAQFEFALAAVAEEVTAILNSLPH